MLNPIGCSLLDIDEIILELEILIKTIQKKGIIKSELNLKHVPFFSISTQSNIEIPQYLTLEIFYKLLDYYNNKRLDMLNIIKNHTNDKTDFYSKKIFEELYNISDNELLRINRKQKLNKIFLMKS